MPLEIVMCLAQLSSWTCCPNLLNCFFLELLYPILTDWVGLVVEPNIWDQSNEGIPITVLFYLKYKHMHIEHLYSF